MRSNAAPRDFDSVWGDDDRSRITGRGSPPGDAKREAYGDIARNFDKLVERNHERSGGSASLSEKDSQDTNLGSKEDLS